MTCTVFINGEFLVMWPILQNHLIPLV